MTGSTMTGHAPNEVIAEYAAGALSPGMSLLVASHLTYCPRCRDKAARLEALGGALLADGAPVAPAPGCLQRALAGIDAPGAAEPAAASMGEALPRPLCRRLAIPVGALPWRPVLPGLTACPLEGFSGEEVGLVRARPGVRLDDRGGATRSSALVLAGELRAGERTYGRGEMKLAAQRLEAVGRESCLCLVVQPHVS